MTASFLIAVILLCDPWIIHWDHGGFAGFDELGRHGYLVEAEYAATDLKADLNRGEIIVVIFNRTTYDLQTDWVAELLTAGVNPALVEQLKRHYRAHLVTDFIRALDPGRYALWVRVRNQFGTWSEWTRCKDIIGRPAAPDAPRDVRCVGC